MDNALRGFFITDGLFVDFESVLVIYHQENTVRLHTKYSTHVFGHETDKEAKEAANEMIDILRRWLRQMEGQAEGETT